MLVIRTAVESDSKHLAAELILRATTRLPDKFYSFNKWSIIFIAFYSVQYFILIYTSHTYIISLQHHLKWQHTTMKKWFKDEVFYIKHSSLASGPHLWFYILINVIEKNRRIFLQRSSKCDQVTQIHRRYSNHFLIVFNCRYFLNNKREHTQHAKQNYLYFL